MQLLYVEPESVRILFFVAGTIAASLVVTIIACSFNANKLVRMYGKDNGAAKAFDNISLVAVILVLVVGFAVVFIQSNMTRDALNTMKENRTSWVESHGVTTQGSTITDLEFPNEAPDEDTKFGVAQVIADDDSIVSVHLAWEDNDFVLYGTDGQPMEVLD